uniref:Uncharacterized protein n=1 Tax=Anguilla anguilla TaxID=7936 RepID=A0A0E9V827_ANGAN
MQLVIAHSPLTYEFIKFSTKHLVFKLNHLYRSDQICICFGFKHFSTLYRSRLVHWNQ